MGDDRICWIIYSLILGEEPRLKMVFVCSKICLGSSYIMFSRLISINTNYRVSSNSLRIKLSLLLLILVIAATYLKAAGFEFILYDDTLYVTENSRVGTGLTYSGIVWAFTTFHASNWHPVTWLSHMLDVQLFGIKPAGHHLVNVGFHLFNTLLLYRLLQRNTGNS